MSKRVKYFSFAIAIIAVAAVMTIAIYAATAANAGITANVSWTASAGIEFELEAWVVNNPAGNGIGNTSTPKSITKQIVTASTSNTTANNLAGDLACGFYDGSNDGVNNPSNIVFTYKIRNTGSGILKVTATKTPTNGAESGTTAADHKPKVELDSSYSGTTATTSQTSAIYGTGYNIPAGGTLEYIITLSIDNAELNISSYDAGVTFNFSVGNQTEVYINNVSQNVNTTATTIGDYINALDVKTYPGYYYDAELTIPVQEEDYSIALADSVVALYTKSATLDKLSFTSNGDGSCSVGALNDEIVGEIIIPQISPAGDRVTGIGNSAFYNCSGLTSVTIPNSVTSIGEVAFYRCTSLTSITIPDSVTSIGEVAFFDCSGLTSITIPNSVTSIGDGAFAGCQLVSITVASGNTRYDSRNNCNAIIETNTNTLIQGCSNTVIPTGVTSIVYGAFSSCSGLTSVTIPNSVTSIGEWAFEGCYGLTSITIGSGVTSIGGSAFYNCSGLTSITIPDSVTSIGDSAFYNCSGLTSITIGSGVTSIGEEAFYDCSGLTSITIGSGVTSIGGNAFYNCSGLTSITIGSGVTSIGDFAFEDCTSLTSITIPDSVTSIGELAFSFCTSLTSIYIPNSVIIFNPSSSYLNSSFRFCSSSLKIYCGASSKPSSWGTYWNYYNTSTALSTTWGVTREQYNSLYA